MEAVQNLILTSMREGTMTGSLQEGGYSWEAKRDPNNEWSTSDQWVMSISVAPYDSEVHNPWFMTWLSPGDEGYEEDIAEGRERLARMTAEEGTPTHMCRVVFRTKWDEVLELVDGTELYLQVDTESGTVKSIWEEIWDGNQPDYYGGPIPEARQWVNDLPGTTGEYYTQLEYPWSE